MIPIGNEKQSTLVGSIFGETDDDLRQELFEWCKAKQKRERES